MKFAPKSQVSRFIYQKFDVLGTEFQLGSRVPVSEKKDPERNVALDRMRAERLVMESGDGSKAGGKAGNSAKKGTRAGNGGTCTGLIIRNEQGKQLAKGGETVITGKLLEQAQARMTDMGKQVSDMFTAFNTKWQAARSKEQAEAAVEMKRMRDEKEELKSRLLSDPRRNKYTEYIG
jgi:hypothetical protein